MMNNTSIKTLILLIFFIGLCSNLCAQLDQIIIPENIYMPKDSMVADKLIKSLNGFLKLKENPNKENSFVKSTDLLETSALLDELKGIEKNRKLEDDHFYKCYVSNVLQLKEKGYLIQFNYLGQNENLPILKASFSIMAHEEEDQFYFYAPLKQNTVSWQSKRMGNTTFYYKPNFDLSKLIAYNDKVSEYDKRLNLSKGETIFYCAENLNEVLKLIGVDYRLDYNGYGHSSLSSIENKTTLIVDGALASDFVDFDPHDLWHDRLRKILSSDQTNRPVDEGCAYLYGGSWGYTWNEVLQKFKSFVDSNPNADWLALYQESKNFGDEKRKPIRIDFVINALLVEKIEKEQGFPAVFKLLSCGKKEEGNENYFAVLEKISGINKNNFNQKVSKLVNDIL